MTPLFITVTVLGLWGAWTAFSHWKKTNDARADEGPTPWFTTASLDAFEHSLSLGKLRNGVRHGQWDVDSLAEPPSTAIVRVKQSVMEALIKPRAAIPTLDPDFDCELEVTLKGAAELEAFSCTFGAELRAAILALKLPKEQTLHIPLLRPNPQRWQRAIDLEPEPAAAMRATLLAQRPEDPTPTAGELLDTLDEGLRKMHLVPVRIRRRWVRALTDVASEDFQDEVVEALAERSRTELVQLWLTDLITDKGPLSPACRRQVTTLLRGRHEESVRVIILRLFAQRGQMVDIAAIHPFVDGPTAVAEAAKEAIASIQARMPGGVRGALTVADMPDEGDLAVSDEDVEATTGALTEA